MRRFPPQIPLMACWAPAPPDQTLTLAKSLEASPRPRLLSASSAQPALPFWDTETEETFKWIQITHRQPCHHAKRRHAAPSPSAARTLGDGRSETFRSPDRRPFIQIHDRERSQQGREPRRHESPLPALCDGFSFLLNMQTITDTG